MSHIASCSADSPTLTEMAASQIGIWKRDRLDWQRKQPVTAALAEHLDIVAVESNRFSTATTDGRHLFINPAWSATLDDAQRRHSQEHLVWHAVAGDYRPRHGTKAHHWHLTCDRSVNTQLLLLGAELPLDAVLFPIAVPWKREAVYAWLSGHPNPAIEQPTDQLCWQAGSSLSFHELEILEAGWQQHIQAIVRQFRGTPWLPDTVALWMLGNR